MHGSFFGKRTLKKLTTPDEKEPDEKVLCLVLNHTLTAKPRDMIFGMYTQVTLKSKIGYVILILKVI